MGFPYTQEEIDKMYEIGERLRKEEGGEKIEKLKWGLCSVEFSIIACKINEIIEKLNEKT